MKIGTGKNEYINSPKQNLVYIMGTQHAVKISDSHSSDYED